MTKYLPAVLGLLSVTGGAAAFVGALLGDRAGFGAAGLIAGGLLLALDRRL